MVCTFRILELVLQTYFASFYVDVNSDLEIFHPHVRPCANCNQLKCGLLNKEFLLPSTQPCIMYFCSEKRRFASLDSTSDKTTYMSNCLTCLPKYYLYFGIPIPTYCDFHMLGTRFVAQIYQLSTNIAHLWTFSLLIWW